MKYTKEQLEREYERNLRENKKYREKIEAERRLLLLCAELSGRLTRTGKNAS